MASPAFYSYEPSRTYRRRQARAFEVEARTAAYNQSVRRRLSDAGYDPDIAPTRPTMFDAGPVIRGRDIDAIVGPEAKKKEGGGWGVLGRVAGAVDDATSKVFGGEIREPWDVLRPVKRVMDAENRYIARPLASRVYEGVSGDDYENAPSWLKIAMETLASPSTYIGGALGGAGKVANIAGRGNMSLKGYAAMTAGQIVGGGLGSVADEELGLGGVGGVAGSFLGGGLGARALSRGTKAGIREDLSLAAGEESKPLPGQTGMFGETVDASGAVKQPAPQMGSQRPEFRGEQGGMQAGIFGNQENAATAGAKGYQPTMAEAGLTNQGETASKFDTPSASNVEPAPLPQDHAARFNVTEDTVEIPLDKLKPSKPPETQPNSVNEAVRRFADPNSKRAPIDVRAEPDGTYTILDGNASYGAAKRSGWSTLPARVVESFEPGGEPNIARGMKRSTTVISPRDITTRPDLFQNRDVEAGSTTGTGNKRVRELSDNFDPAQFTPPSVVPDPENPGKYIVYRGHHRTEAWRKVMGADQPIEVKLVDADINDPGQLAKLQLEGDASNFKTATPNFREQVRTISRMEQVGLSSEDIAGRMRKSASEIDGLKDAARLGDQAVDAVVTEPALGPYAAEIGRGMRMYGFDGSAASGWFNRIATAKKGERATPGALRQTIDKYGKALTRIDTSEMFGGADVFGGSRGGVLEAIDANAKLRANLTNQIAKVKKMARDADKLLGGGSKREQAAGATVLKAAKREQARLERSISQSDKDVLAALRQANAAAPAKLGAVSQASPSASSSEGVSGGAVKASEMSTPEGRTQAVPVQRSETALSPSSTTRKTTPSFLSGVPSVTEGPPVRGLGIGSASRPILHEINDVDEILARASRKKPDLDAGLKSLPDAEFISSRVKGVSRIGEKLGDRQANQVTDYLGARVVTEDPATTVSEIAQRFPIVEGMDQQLDRPGYRARHLQVHMGDGITAEVQVLDPGMAAVQEFNHVFYEAARAEDSNLATIHRAEAAMQYMISNLPEGITPAEAAEIQRSAFGNYSKTHAAEDVHPTVRPLYDEAMRIYTGERKPTIVRPGLFDEPAASTSGAGSPAAASSALAPPDAPRPAAAGDAGGLPPTQPGLGLTGGSKGPPPPPGPAGKAALERLFGPINADYQASGQDQMQQRVMNLLRQTAGDDAAGEQTARGIMRERDRLRGVNENLSNRLAAVAGRRMRAAFQLDKKGQIQGVPALPNGQQPTIADLAARLPLYEPSLNEQQMKAIGELRDELTFYNHALVGQGVPIQNRADVMDGGGFYVPRGQADIEGVDAPRKVSAGGGRPGMKKGFERAASFDSQAEGIAAGYEYATVEEAMRSYAQDAGGRALDQYASQLFKQATDAEGNLIGETPHARVMKQNGKLAGQVKDLRKTVKSLKGSVGRLEKNHEEVLTRFIDAGEPDFDELDNVLAELRARPMLNQRGQTVREARIALNDAQEQLRALKPEWKRAVDQAQHPSLKSQQGQLGFAQLQGTSFPLAMANEVNGFLNREQARPNVLKAANNLLRGLNATADLSFMGIQGLLGLVHDPIGYGKAWGVAMKSLRDPEALAKYIDDFDGKAAAAGTPTSRELIQAGLRLGGIDTEFTLGRGLQLGKLHGVQEANRSFGYFGDALRLDAAAAMVKNNPGADLRQLTHAANLMTGWTKGRFLGDYGEYVQFAPRFFQAQLELAGRALTDRTATGNQARQMLGKLMGFGTLATVLANEASGNPTDFDPTSPNFMRIRAGDRDVSLFGAWDSLVKATMRAGQGDFEYLARTKAAPWLRITWDALEGRNFVGEETLNPLKPGEVTPDKVGNFLKGMLPISVQNVIEEPKPGLGTALDVTGVKSAALSKADVLDELARDGYGKGWDELRPAEISKLAQQFPDRIDGRTARQAAGIKATLEPYYDIEDQVWDKIATRPEFEGFDTLDEYVDAKAEALRHAGTPEGQISRQLQQMPVVQQVQRAVSELRRRLRAKDPEIDRALVDWYGAAPIRAQ